MKKHGAKVLVFLAAKMNRLPKKETTYIPGLVRAATTTVATMTTKATLAPAAMAVATKIFTIATGMAEGLAMAEAG